MAEHLFVAEIIVAESVAGQQLKKPCALHRRHALHFKK
jgi:hypothetical protein